MKEKIIVMVFKEEDCPKTDKWSSIYRMDADKIEEVTEELVRITDK